MNTEELYLAVIGMVEAEGLPVMDGERSKLKRFVWERRDDSAANIAQQWIEVVYEDDSSDLPDGWAICEER